MASYTTPLVLTAGDTWEWKKQYPLYPVTHWTLTYTFFNAQNTFNVGAVIDGSDFLLRMTPLDTANIVPGRYDWVATVSNGIDRYTLNRGVLKVNPNVQLVGANDGRSHARIMYDALTALLENRATRGQVDIVRAEIGQQGMQYDIATLIKMRSDYAEAVRREQQAKRTGQAEFSRLIQTRFL